MGKYIAFATVEYDEDKPENFKGIKITYGDKVKIFNTGDPLIDWFNYSKFLYLGEAIKEEIFSIRWSSSADHWFMDTDEYLEKYLKENGDEYEFMTEDDLKFMSFQDMDRALKCVIHKEMKSFEELREYYKKHKNKAVK